MTPCVIGIDGGGTKTVCLVASLDGDELGRATGGPSNYQTIGAQATEAVLIQVIRAAAADAARRRPDGLHVESLCLALAGVDRPDDRRAVQDIALGVITQDTDHFRWALDLDQVVIENDAVASLVGGTGRKVGLVAVAGTGSIAFGMNAQGDRRRAGGWGYLLGDEGSGYAVGLAGLRAICRAHDRRAPQTDLTRSVMQEHQLASPSDLISRAYGSWAVPEIAAIAPLVFRAAADGDAVARDIVEAAAAELVVAAGAVIDALGMAHEPFEVVTAGGAWQGSALLRERFAAGVAAAAPVAKVIAPRAEPVHGAVLLAREAIGVASID